MLAAGAVRVLVAALSSATPATAGAEEAATAALAALFARSARACAEADTALPSLVQSVRGSADRPITAAFAAIALGFVVRLRPGPRQSLLQNVVSL